MPIFVSIFEKEELGRVLNHCIVLEKHHDVLRRAAVRQATQFEANVVLRLN